MATIRYFATCARGLEPVLSRELAMLPAGDIVPGRGGVAFAGDGDLIYRANLWLRTAVRVLRPILEAPAGSTDELYERAGSIDWFEFLTTEHTFAVDANVRDSAITHSHYAALRVKDAVCDQFMAKAGRRPSVNVQEPMVKLNLHIYRDEMVLSLDSSGESLHKRGYRPILTKAPLNEALAAALVLLAGWNGSVPLIDLMCGSGTIPIEASWIALARPPGLTRKRFGFHGWLDFDIARWTAIRDEARQGVLKELPAPVLGFDLRRDAVRFAETNARAAGVGHLLRFAVQDVKDFQPDASMPPGVLICNPPYGERIGETDELLPLYRALGETLKSRCAGWTAYIFSGNPELEDHIGLRPAERIPLFNGAISCMLLKYELW